MGDGCDVVGVDRMARRLGRTARLGSGLHDAHDRPIVPDGNFGPGTKAAVKEFQASQDLLVDGVAGTKTLDALKNATQADLAPTLADAVHPGHALYIQSLSAVHRLDAEHGRTPDQCSANLAGALTVAARSYGMSGVDHVLLSDDASRAFAVQGEISSDSKRFTHVDVVQAVTTPLAQSSAQWQQDIQQLTPAQSVQQTPQQAPQIEQPVMQR